jgi:hypothetical protein
MILAFLLFTIVFRLYVPSKKKASTKGLIIPYRLLFTDLGCRHLVSRHPMWDKSVITLGYPWGTLLGAQIFLKLCAHTPSTHNREKDEPSWVHVQLSHWLYANSISKLDCYHCWLELIP